MTPVLGRKTALWRGAIFAVIWAFGAMLGLSQAATGPWARTGGDVFLAFSISAEELRDALLVGPIDPEQTMTAYAEVGFGHGFTGVLDLSYGETGALGVARLRYTLSAADAAWQFAVDAGVGLRQIEGQQDRPLIRLGASVGRGLGAWSPEVRWLQGWIPLGHRGGWTTLEGGALYDIERDEVIWQAEATVGAQIGAELSGALSLKAEAWPGGDPFLTARPSVIYSLRENTTLQLGAHFGVFNSQVAGLSLSIWQEF